MKKQLRAVALAAAVVAGTFGVAPAAQAAVNDGTCDSGEVCAFKDINYGGGPFDDISTNDSVWTNNRYGTNGAIVNDSASSGFAIDRAMAFCVDGNFNGHQFVLGVNQYDSAWLTGQPNASGGPGYNYNDRISSNHVVVPI